MNAQIWQMVQSSSTKAENLENDFDGLATGWRDDKGSPAHGMKKKKRAHEDDQVVQVLNPLMESILVLVTEWIS